MKRAGWIVLLCALFATPGAAQSRPDFNGVWTPTAVKPDPKAAAGGSVGLPPSDLTIQQTGTTLSMSRTYFERVTTQTFALDGSESTNKSGAVTRVTRSRWAGKALVTEGKASQVTSQGYAAWTFTETLSINPRGHLLVENRHVAADGTVTTSTQDYTRKKGA
jgi:hypothetical protein